MLWKWITKAKDLYDWYSFSSAIVSWIVLAGVVSGVGVSVVGVATAVIKGVPWPIILMAGVSTLLASACLAATPLIIRAAMPAMQQPVPEPNNTPQPIRPNYDAWKHVDKFTVRRAACLLEDLEPTLNLRDPKMEPWIAALCASIRKGEIDFIVNTEALGGYHTPIDGKNILTRQQKENPTDLTEISKAALMDFAKRNDIDLKYLDQ